MTCPLFQRVTQHHGMCMMSLQMLPENRHTHVRHAALHHGGRDPLGTMILLSTVLSDYRWMSSDSSLHRLAKIPSTFRVSCRPSSQTVDCSRPPQTIRLDPFLHSHISFTVSDKQFKVPCDIIYRGLVFGTTPSDTGFMDLHWRIFACRKFWFVLFLQCWG